VDVVKGRIIRGLVGHQGSFVAVAFAPQGDVLATGGTDGTVRLWKINTGEELRCFRGHLGTADRLAWSADAKMLISAGSDNCILVWDATSRAPIQPADPVAQNLDRSWADLANSDAKTAFQAIGEMIAQPKETVALLAMKLQPVPQVDAALIDQLAAELDSDNFTKRQKATKALEKLESQARPALEKVLAKPPSAEARSRAKQLLDRLDGPISTPEDLRIIRAVEVLERIANPEARELLARLAKGAPAARLTLESSASLARLTK